MMTNAIKHIKMAARAVVLMGVLLLPVLNAQAQLDSGPVEKAKMAYNEGDYGQAAELFAAVAANDTLDMAVRREASLYLCRAHFAQGHEEAVREAVGALLDLEPPLIELDPDMEAPPLMDVYYEMRKEKQDGSLEVPKANPDVRTLAIMDFRNYALADKDQWEAMQWGFSSMMIEQLSGATDLKLVERENLQYLLDELDLQSSQRVDQATAVKMGKMLGAHAMVFGGIFVNGNKLTLNARVVKVETGEILLGESSDGRVKDFYEVLEKLSLKVSQSVNSELTENEIGARTETQSLDAMQAFSAGMELAEEGKYQAAYEKYMEAYDLDQSYTKAKRRAESLMPMLAVQAPTEGSDTGS